MGIAGTIARNTTFAFITSLSELGIVFVTGIMLTRGLGTEQYGLYAYMMWFLGLAGLIGNLGLGEMTRRFIPEAVGRQDTREPAGFVQFALMYRLAVSLVICFVILISAGYWARMSGSQDNQLLFVVAALTTLPDALQQAAQAIFKGFQKFEYALYLQLSMSPLRLVLIIVFMSLGLGVMEILLLNIGILTLGVVVSFFLTGRLIPLKSLLSRSLLSGERKKQAWIYALNVTGILLLSYLVSQQAATFFIGLYCSVEDVGFYTLAFKIASMVGLLSTAFGYVLLPVIAEQFGKGETEKMKQIYISSLRYLMVVTLPLAAGGIALADSIIILFYGADYQPAVLLLQLVSLPIAFSSINVGDLFIRAINRPSFILKTLVVFSVVNIGLCLWLIPRYGILGATIASSVPLVLTLPVHVIYISKRVGIGWPMRDTIKISVASVIMGIAVYVLHTHLSTVLSIALCIPLGVVIYFAAIFALRVIKEEDLVIIRKVQESLPQVLRKYYTPFVGLMEKVVGRTKLATDP